jgi:hypothetical protein
LRRNRTSIAINSDQGQALLALCPLDGVGGWVFTQGIEHIFENRAVLMMQEVLL